MSDLLSHSPAVSHGREMRIGLIFALAAHLWWGFVPLYFRQTVHIQPLVVLSHRVLWTALLLTVIIGLQRRWREVAAAIRSPRMLAALVASAVLIAVNWLVFIYAVTWQQVTHVALGYYINPLICVLLGLLVLGETLTATQWVSLLIAASAVAFAAVSEGAMPWISLTLATSFALYALIRKLVPIGPVIGLVVESIVLVPVAAGVLIWTAPAGTTALSPSDHLLLSLSGIVTALPLLWFAAAVRRLRLSTMGFLQYVGPSTQFLLAVTILREPLTPQRLATFAMIWLALGIFTWHAWRTHRVPATARVEIVE